MVAARKLRSWGFETEIILPQRKKLLREIPALQLKRASDVGVDIISELPKQSSNRELVVIDAYLGYGFKPRRDDISENVYVYLRSESRVVCLDVPSGLDPTSGESYSKLIPLATMAIAFLKRGLLCSSTELTGDLYTADIGVPLYVYQFQLDLSWSNPNSLSELKTLYTRFTQDSLQKVKVSKKGNTLEWGLSSDGNQ